MNKTKSILFSTLFLLLSMMAIGQSHVVAGGNSVNMTGGSISYTIGQIDYQYATDTSGKLSEGVQQPLEIFTISVEEENDLSNLFNVYPNPTSTSFNLQSDNLAGVDYIVTLYSLDGKELLKKNVFNGIQEFSMEEFSQGTYFLNIQTQERIVKTFKIIKN